jgi:hypothetical protein
LARPVGKSVVALELSGVVLNHVNDVVVAFVVLVTQGQRRMAKIRMIWLSRAMNPNPKTSSCYRMGYPRRMSR